MEMLNLLIRLFGYAMLFLASSLHFYLTKIKKLISFCFLTEDYKFKLFKVKQQIIWRFGILKYFRTRGNSFI